MNEKFFSDCVVDIFKQCGYSESTAYDVLPLVLNQIKGKLFELPKNEFVKVRIGQCDSNGDGHCEVLRSCRDKFHNYDYLYNKYGDNMFDFFKTDNFNLVFRYKDNVLIFKLNN